MNKLETLLSGVGTVAIAGHIKPDGDCIGSCLAVYQYIREQMPQVQADVFMQEIPECFEILDGIEEVKPIPSQNQEYDLFISLDSSDSARLEGMEPIFQKAGKTLCVDHHISNNGFADINIICPDASSTCEVLYGLLEDEKISAPVAAALYLGIVHDTGVFQYSCTSPETMRIAAKLMEKDIPFTQIIDKTFYEKTYVQNQILGRALLESIQFLDKKCVVTAISKKDMDFYGVKPSDLDGIVSQLRVIKGVEVALFLYETAACTYKVSMRSNGKVDVSQIASMFGGGGHKMAAGCTFAGTVHDVVNSLSYYIEQQLKAGETT